MTTPDEATSKMRIIDHVEATINKFHGLNSKQIKDKLPAINPDSICPAIDALKKAKTIRGVDSDEGNWAVFYPVPPTINQLTGGRCQPQNLLRCITIERSYEAVSL